MFQVFWNVSGVLECFRCSGMFQVFWNVSGVLEFQNIPSRVWTVFTWFLHFVTRRSGSRVSKFSASPLDLISQAYLITSLSYLFSRLSCYISHGHFM